MAALVAAPQDTPATAATVLGDGQHSEEHVPDKISAYYSLVFPNFTYYLQTLNVTIGRRCIPANTASSSENPQVDVDLGPLKSVSRLHARIEYDEDEERFVLVVVGRNGAWVDGVWSGSGSRVPLGDRYVASALQRPYVAHCRCQVADTDRIAHLPLCASPAASTARRFSLAQLALLCGDTTTLALCRRYLP